MIFNRGAVTRGSSAYGSNIVHYDVSIDVLLHITNGVFKNYFITFYFILLLYYYHYLYYVDLIVLFSFINTR